MRRTTPVSLILACSAAFSGVPALAQAGSYKVLHSFDSSDGDYPVAGLVNIGGTLYGTTEGLFDAGTVFSFNLKTGVEAVLHYFGGQPDGVYPSGSLINVSGLLYGTTGAGGSTSGCPGNYYGGCGTVFSVDPATGSENVLYSFKGGKDGAGPSAGLIKVGGELFGTTGGGGLNNAGTVFSVALKNGREKIVHRFNGDVEPYSPRAALTMANGILYGTAIETGGSVFSIDPKTGAETVVYAFKGYPDASGPNTSLLNVGGTLFGTATGTLNGAVFSVNLSEVTEAVTYWFQGGSDGYGPNGSLIEVGGLLYGTTLGGGNSTNCSGGGCGTVYSLNPTTGTETVLHSFGADGNDGASPYGALLNVGGKLYGTTRYGGKFNQGTIFEIKP